MVEVSRVSRVLFVIALVGCAGDRTPIVGEGDPCRTAGVPYPDATQIGDVRHVHDPEIVEEGGAYYVLSTNDGIPIRRSTDLVGWTFVGRVFPNQLPPWAAGEVPGVEAPWAPGVGFFAGRHHLYYSLSTFGSPRSVIGLATNVTLDPASSDYAWVDRGSVVESFAGDDYNAIDAAVVEDVEGGLWLVWGSWGGGIKMRGLDRDTGLFSDDPTLHTLARRPIERALEGPYIVHRAGWYYLFVSFDLCCRGVESTYTVRVGRSELVTGPYRDRDGVPMTEGGGSVVLAGYGNVRGPGHASVLGEDGEQLLVHHFYDAGDGGVPRLQVRPLVWDEDGWPLAAAPYDGAPLGPPPPAVDPAGRWGYAAGDQGARAVDLGPDGRAVACDREGQWAYAAPRLTVQWPADGGPARVDRSILSADGRSLVGRTSDDRIVRGFRLP